MNKTESYFLELPEEKLISEIPALFELLNEEKIVKTQALADLLIKFPNEITPYIFGLFESETINIRMKEWSLEEIIPKLPFFVKIALEDSLQRVAKAPTDAERKGGLDVKAENVLNSFI